MADIETSGYLETSNVRGSLADGPECHLNAGGVEIGHDGADADLVAIGDARKGIRDRDREPLLAHHLDRHALFAERVVHVIGRVTGHPRDSLGLERPHETVRRLDLHRLLPASFDPAAISALSSPPRAMLAHAYLFRWDRQPHRRRRLMIVDEILG
jgi:hypothetical protein